jgi:hypothetical protein
MNKTPPNIPLQRLNDEEVLEQKMRLLANFMIDRILENKNKIVPKSEPKNDMIKVNSPRKDGTQ